MATGSLNSNFLIFSLLAACACASSGPRTFPQNTVPFLRFIVAANGAVGSSQNSSSL
jgi:hypothetical protein